jgi:hypothetical protein
VKIVVKNFPKGVDISVSILIYSSQVMEMQLTETQRKLIRTYRQAEGITQAELAGTVEVTMNTVWRIEARGSGHQATIRAIVDELHIPPGLFYGLLNEDNHIHAEAAQ